MSINPAVSGSVTLVVQESPVQLVLRASPQPARTPLSILTRFGAILIKYGAEKDILSQNLMVTGHTFMVYAVQNHGKPFNELLQGAIEKIAEIQKVLKNPFGTSTFKEPWLIDGVVTWDKSTLDEYQEYVGRFSDKVIEATPHRFAQEVLEWIAQFPIQTRAPALLEQGTGQVARQQLALPKEVLDYQRYMQYEHLINQSKKLQQSLGLIKQLEEMNLALEEANIEGFRRFEQTLARQEESQLQQTAELQRGIGALQTQQQATVALYKEANDEAQATLRKVKAALDEAHVQMNRQQAQISSLCSQLNSCYAQLGHLQNELNNADSGCSLM